MRTVIACVRGDSDAYVRQARVQRIVNSKNTKKERKQNDNMMTKARSTFGIVALTFLVFAGCNRVDREAQVPGDGEIVSRTDLEALINSIPGNVVLPTAIVAGDLPADAASVIISLHHIYVDGVDLGRHEELTDEDIAAALQPLEGDVALAIERDIAFSEAMRVVGNLNAGAYVVARANEGNDLVSLTQLLGMQNGGSPQPSELHISELGFVLAGRVFTPELVGVDPRCPVGVQGVCLQAGDLSYENRLDYAGLHNVVARGRAHLGGPLSVVISADANIPFGVVADTISATNYLAANGQIGAPDWTQAASFELIGALPEFKIGDPIELRMRLQAGAPIPLLGTVRLGL